MNINKDLFIKYIQKLKELTSKKHQLYLLGLEIETFDDYEPIIINLLKLEFNDKEEWIDYFIYELDYGEKWTKNSVKFKDREIDLSTAEKLYDWLIELKEVNS